jgi:Tfp pilus assembly protein PilN
MINLLPTESQHRNHAAHLNLMLRTYIIVLFGVLLVVLGIFGLGFYLTMQDRSVAEQQLQSNQQETASYQKVRNEAKTFAGNLKIAKSILSQETLYSDLVAQIAQTLPSSAVLSSLTLDSTSTQKPMLMTARVKTKSDALVLKNTLETSPLFEDVNLASVTDPPASEGIVSPNRIVRDFPIIVTLNAKMSKKAAGNN